MRLAKIDQQVDWHLEGRGVFDVIPGDIKVRNGNRAPGLEYQHFIFQQMDNGHKTCCRWLEGLVCRRLTTSISGKIDNINRRGEIGFLVGSKGETIDTFTMGAL